MRGLASVVLTTVEIPEVLALSSHIVIHIYNSRNFRGFSPNTETAKLLDHNSRNSLEVFSPDGLDEKQT